MSTTATRQRPETGAAALPAFGKEFERQLEAQGIEEVVCTDTEFIVTPGNRPIPVCIAWHEMLSGRRDVLFARDLQRHKPPFRTDKTRLGVAYYASAEAGFFIAQGWPWFSKTLDLFVEFKHRLGGRKPDAGLGLLGCMIHHGLSGVGAEEKDEMRNLILRGPPWTEAEEEAIGWNYCYHSDVRCLVELLPLMAPHIDLPRALLRGRYMFAAACMEWYGVPVDTASLNAIRAGLSDDSVKVSLIKSVDKDCNVYEGTHFRSDKFEAYLTKHHMIQAWPRTETGQLSTEDGVFESMCKCFPQVQSLHNLRQLRSIMGKLKLNDIAIGDDGRNRTILSAFRSKTGRNQPSNAKFVFLADVWLRSVIQPKPSWAIAYIDWSQQEFAIAAALSEDPNMMHAYQSGDCYLEFAKLAGAIPRHINKDNFSPKKPLFLSQNPDGSPPVDYEPIRDRYKTCVLAVQYGQSEFGLAKRLGISEIEAGELLQRHRETFRVYWRWQHNMLNSAAFDLETETPFGWRLDLSEIYSRAEKVRLTERTVQNFPMQAAGSDMLRIACIRACERGIRVCAPIHDALLIEAREENIDRVVAETQACMAQAGRDVLDGFELRSDAKIVRYPNRYVDWNRGAEMWNKIADEVGLERVVKK
jgi:DNA polymerase I